LRLPGNPIFKLTALVMKTIGSLSRGIQIGWQSGFDSGLSLDHVYRNVPEGSNALGRWIDRSYINSIGWRGIRQRKVNLEALLKTLIQKIHSAGDPVRIMDVATGGGRYVLETMRDLPEIPITAMLRDYKEENVEAARALAAELKLGNVTVERADAFDRESLASVRPRPTITIVSGLYELFPTNAPIRTSLSGIAEVMEVGSYLIYTNQPWHPQMEFIARVLRNREGQPWIMRRRTQAEMDQLIASAGFEKVGMEIDQWGIFSVSVARRIRS
jgi:hypothetical protein